jgi:ribonuclease T2
MRRAYQGLAIPVEFKNPHDDIRTSPDAIEAAFVAANPGMPERGIAVTCSRNGLVEVRICVGKDLRFRRCLEVDDDQCRKPTLFLAKPD